MAIAAVSEVEAARLCGNCKKDIPAANFIIHEIHCSRNIEVCSYCSECIPKSEMKNHIESEHVQVTCKCRMKMESSLLKDHEASACPLRPALCQFCDIPLTFNKLQDHEVYCGARTERCGGCGQNVMVKDLKEHPRVCGQEVKKGRGRRTVPRSEGEDGDLLALRDVRTRLRSEDYLDQLASNQTTHSSLYDEWNADLDYVLALSLQNENNPPNNTADDIPSDFWESYYTKESVPSACLHERDKANIFSCDSLASLSTSNCAKRDEIIMLPCEFCEELYPAEDLILHQTGCNPASAFASFSKRSSSPNLREYNGLRAPGSKSCRALFSSQTQAVWEAENTIPCEFCGIQLEEETLFHHQHHCALRLANPTAGFKPQQLRPPHHSNPGRRDSPELARRRVRHQGDVSLWCAEDFGQQRLSCPARETKLLNATANTRTAPLSSARASDAPSLRGKPRKASGNEGRLKSRGAGGSAGGTMLRERPAQNSPSEAFTPSFSRPPPSQPSTSSGGGRSLRVAEGANGFRRRSSQAKAQSPASGHPEK
ncbi:TRAF-type zinc finger domain-containing protein 1 isoform X2 [Dryobates pubescens]|uniref:TRAF-type zinc finger domain-containing protein 1 isoform X2 n=1 Tax=Dryobates pubescens TaxID=118200 RepID=UPI0023B9FB31|nr:TRAF-type zinc finger domain-containing protein 1 isoform X2 [Dryobates pubescens]